MGLAPSRNAGAAMTKPTQAQVAFWDAFKQVARRAALETQSTMLEFEQLKTLYAFRQSKGMPVGFDPVAIAAQAKTVYDRGEKLKNSISGVELGTLGLRFGSGEIDIMAPPGTSDDVIANYALNGWPIIIAGIVVGGSIIAWLSASRQQASELGGKLSALKDDGDSLMCADPSSQLCAEWTKAKELSGYERRENVIDQIEQQAAALPDAVKKFSAGLGVGVAVAAVAVAGYLLWAKKSR